MRTRDGNLDARRDKRTGRESFSLVNVSWNVLVTGIVEFERDILLKSHLVRTVILY